MDIPRGWIWPAGHQLINTNLNHAIINPSTPELPQNLQQWLQRRFSNLDISLEKTFDPDRYSGSWTFPGYSQSLLAVLSWSDLLLRVFFVILLYYSTSIQAVLWDPGKKIKYSSTVAVSNSHLLDAFYHVIQQSLLFFHIKISMTVSTSGLKHLWLKNLHPAVVHCVKTQNSRLHRNDKRMQQFWSILKRLRETTWQRVAKQSTKWNYNDSWTAANLTANALWAAVGLTSLYFWNSLL